MYDFFFSEFSDLEARASGSYDFIFYIFIVFVFAGFFLNLDHLL